MTETQALWSHLSAWLVLGGAFACALPLGATLAAARYCTLGAVSDWCLLGDTRRLRMWAAAAGSAVLGVYLLEHWADANLTATLVPYASPHFAWPRYIAGGFMFGIGMHLAGGCASRQLQRLGGGSLKAALALAVAAVTAAWLIDGGGYRSWLAPLLDAGRVDLRAFGLPDQRLGTLLGFEPDGTGARLTALIAGNSLLLVAAGFSRHRLTRLEWLAGIGLGAAVGAGWWLTAGPLGKAWQEDMAFLDALPRGVGAQSYTFISPLADLAGLARGRGSLTFGLCGAAGLVTGSLAWHWRRGRLRLERHRDARDLLRTVLGGALLAFGGVTALGCTVGQGVTGLSTLALGSMLATLATVAGAASAIRLEYAWIGAD
jgi:uncharacterized membrane protein YedE/YeeE